jgi:hypothetical protein
VVREVRTRDGRTLTEAEIEQLADWVEGDVDPGSWKPHPGRPRIDLKATKHTPRIAVRVPENVRRGAKARAASEGRSISAVVRDLLEAYAQGS